MSSLLKDWTKNEIASDDNEYELEEGIYVVADGFDDDNSYGGNIYNNGSAVNIYTPR